MSNSYKGLVWRLLRRNISAGQIAGYALATLVGLSIVLCAVRFYGDVSSAFNTDDGILSKDYMVISKRVSALNTVGRGGETFFTPAETEELSRQPWVRSVGAFTAANFNVYMSVDLGGRSMSTYMFLESIPDKFLDVSPSDWRFDPSRPEVPIIMSKEYLALYNFGFAASRGMPQLSETVMARVPLSITVSGNGRSMKIPGRIVGFSSRLNTLAVPQDFMEWANKEFAPPGKEEQPSRLIVEVSKPGDPAIDRFMRINGYDVAGDKADNSRANYFLTLVTAIVIAIGSVISILAFFILMLSIFLLLQKNRRKLHDLMLLGYSPRQAARPYNLLVLSVNVAVLVLSIVITECAAAWWNPRLADIGVPNGSPLPALLTGLCIMAVVTVANLLTIRRLVRRNF
ncbi:MAG: ABC transporter permease [Muribaculaceae bacterium]|nr:ABC transporter permease [Muribaculaceae bacterium]